MSTNRRAFIKKIAAFSTVAGIIPDGLAAISGNESKGGDGYTFLFQGDSITDGNRTRNNDWNHVMGHGYQFIIASKLWYEFPQMDFHFFNRGISGNKITDLAERWQKDTLDLRPDLLSILIGINDVSAFINGNKNFSVEEYEKGYKNLLDRTKAALPHIQFVLCEPFVLPVGRVKENWSAYESEVKSRQEVVKELSKDYNAIFVGFQDAF